MEADPDFQDHQAAKEFTCPVCLSLAVHPQLNPPCGHHYCNSCAERLVSKGQPCPECRADIVNLVPDKFFERKMNELKVLCPFRKDGCKWVGPLSDLQYHKERCMAHLQVCEFNYAGCQARFSSDDYAKHMYEALAVHVTLLSRHVRLKSDENLALKTAISLLGEELQATRKAAQDQVATAHEEILKANKRLQIETEKFQAADARIARLEKQLAVVTSMACPTLVMPHFYSRKTDGKDWYSPPFYSHSGGYKMCLRVVARGQLAGANTHVSVYVHMMPGENDRYLKWPFSGDITLCLLNQRMDKGHIERTVSLSGPDAGRVTGREHSFMGQGFNCFVPHSDLSCNAAGNAQYLVNDSLKFRVVRVTVI